MGNSGKDCFFHADKTFSWNARVEFDEGTTMKVTIRTRTLVEI